jgi:hypothetical protein
MTLADIKDYCAGKLGLDDTLTKDKAGEFARARWRMLWNNQLWRQTRHVDTISVAAGLQEVTLPAEFGFALAIRWGDSRLLTATLDLSALAKDPGGWALPGDVLGFSLMPRSADGRARIRLHRVPSTAGTLLVIGKRTCIELLADTDTPLLTGSDECLCAFVMGDLYQWMRQLGKAQAFFQEANAHLAKMVEIETAQTTESRQLTPEVQQLEGGDHPWA